MLGVKVRSALWRAGRGHPTCWGPRWQRNGAGPTGGTRPTPSEQPRARGCSPDYGKMRAHHTRPTASRTFEGEGSGQPGDAFWKELIMSHHLRPSTKMYKYLQHARRLLSKECYIYTQIFTMQIPNQTNFNVFLLSSISSTTAT